VLENNMKRMCQTSHNKHQWEGVALAWLSNFSTSQLFQRNHCASTVAAQTSAPDPTDGLMVTTDFHAHRTTNTTLASVKQQTVT
jgi:hypothetical protein